jgi:hypothetical protein
MPSIFLSHSHSDKEFARMLSSRLSEEGVKVWIDEAEINVGDSLIEKIETAIAEMDYVGVILSPASIQSQWVLREVRQAVMEEIHSRKVKVLPLLRAKCDVPGFLADKFYVDFQEDFDGGFRTLMKRLKPWEAFYAAGLTLPKYDWSQKAIRIGLDFNTLEVFGGSVRFSGPFIGALSDVCREDISGNCEVFQEGKFPLLTVKAILWTHPGGPEKPVTQEAVDCLLQEVHPKVVDYVMQLATIYGVIHEIPGGYILDQNLGDEFVHVIAEKGAYLEVISLKTVVQVLHDLCGYNALALRKGDGSDWHLVTAPVLWMASIRFPISELISGTLI